MLLIYWIEFKNRSPVKNVKYDLSYSCLVLFVPSILHVTAYHIFTKMRYILITIEFYHVTVE